jgi:hypothetical protein
VLEFSLREARTISIFSAGRGFPNGRIREQPHQKSLPLLARAKPLPFPYLPILFCMQLRKVTVPNISRNMYMALMITLFAASRMYGNTAQGCLARAIFNFSCLHLCIGMNRTRCLQYIHSLLKILRPTYRPPHTFPTTIGLL